MFLNTTTNDIVNCELLQTIDFGSSWQRVAPEGTEFIPRGPPGSFDSHTLYTAWSGAQGALLDPLNANVTLFYYAGVLSP